MAEKKEHTGKNFIIAFKNQNILQGDHGCNHARVTVLTMKHASEP